MPDPRAFPDDVAAALERNPEARDRFAALPEQQQVEWLRWIDRARGRRGRAERIQELIRRLLPQRAATEEEVAGPPPRNYWWVWLLLLLLLVVGGLLAWYFLTRGSDKTTVPDVTGLQQPAAEQRIRDKHLDPLSRTGRSNRPLGVVFAQVPGAGTQVGKNQTVTISVSAGPGTVVVPRLVGLSQGDAVSALTKAKLAPQLNNVASKKPSGTVIGQKPPGGKSVPQGSTVTLNVSTGTGGKGTTTATTTTTTTTATTTTSATTTSAGATSTTPVAVPTVSSLAQTPALRRLNTLGLRPTVVYVQSSQPANRVVAQKPAAGTKLRPGSRVRVSVSMGPNPQASTSVPDVTGEDQATAAQDLRSAGFRVAVLNRPTKDQSKDGMVVEQQPKAGSNIPGGLQVTIFIGRFSG